MRDSNSYAGVAIVIDDADLIRTYEQLFRHWHVPVTFIACEGKSALDKFRNTSVKPVR